MKKLLSFACICAVGAAWADANPTEIKCGNDIGSLEICSMATNLVVAVPFGELSTGDAICASNVVKTANLTAGDELYVYNGGTWTAWELRQTTGPDAYRYWQSVGTASFNDKGQIVHGSTSAPNETYLAAGSAIWLKRQHPEVGKVLVYGSYKQVLSTPVTADVNNLVANPTEKELDITTGAADGDVVRRISSAGTTAKPYKKVTGGWEYTGTYVKEGKTRVGVLTNDTFTISAGQGVWYKPVVNRTITWREAAN